MYNKVDTNMNFVEREKKTEQFWRENNIFIKSMENRKEGETYTFYDGPPTANGKPHIGHVETRTIKDMIPRFQTMKGKYVPIKETIRGLKEIIEGKHEELPESAFLFVGTIDEAVEKGRQIAESEQ